MKSVFLPTWSLVYLLSFLVILPGANAAELTTGTEAALREAVSQGGTVNFSFDGTITLTNTIAITRDVTLDASGHAVVISGDQKVRLFEVAAGVHATFINLTLANGWQVMTNDWMAPPTNQVDAFGGGIFNRGGTLDLLSCVLSNNVASGAMGVPSFPPVDPGVAEGGAIYNDSGVLNITNTIFIANSVTGGKTVAGGAFPIGGMPGTGSGGAIYNRGGQVHLSQSQFRRNTANGGAPNFDFLYVYGEGSAYGGALHSSGGGVLIQQSTFTENQALGTGSGNSGNGNGGAISLTNSTLRCFDSVFLDNAAQGCPGGGRFGRTGEGRGGAIYNFGQAAFSHCLFRSNEVVLATGSDTQNNDDAKGGAIYSLSDLSLTGCTVAENRAQGSDGQTSPMFAAPSVYAGHAYGGGIYGGGALHITNVTFYANLALGGSMAPGFISEPGAAGLGGGLYFATGTAAVVNVTFANNSASGGSGDPAGTSAGGGIYCTNASVTLWNSILAHNSSGNNSFGPLVDGGHNLSSDGSCNFTNTGSRNNTDPKLGPLVDNGGLVPTMALLTTSPAIDAGDDVAAPLVDQRGVSRPQGAHVDIGAFEAEVSSLIVTESSDTALRTAMAQGGTVKVAVNGTITLTNTMAITKNVTLDSSGYAVVLSGNQQVRLFDIAPGVNVTFINLTLADGWHKGQEVYSDGTNWVVPEVTAGRAFGGAVWNRGGNVTLINCVLSNNAALGAGSFGSVYPPGSASGGAIFNEAGILNITNTLFISNNATGGPLNSGIAFPGLPPGGNGLGGAIYNEAGQVLIGVAWFRRNTALGGMAGMSAPSSVGQAGHGFGGALHSAGGTVSIKQSTFTENQALADRTGSTPTSHGHGGALSLTNTLLVCSETGFFTNYAAGNRTERYVNSGEGRGGALWSIGEATLANCLFRGNTAGSTGIGSGIGGSFSGLKPNGRGGAVYALGKFTATACALTENRAVGDKGYSGFWHPPDYPGHGLGGAIYSEAALYLTNTTLFNNQAQGGAGQTDAEYPLAGGSGMGGGLYQEGGAAVLVNVTLAGNGAVGEIGAPVGLGAGGAIYATNTTVTVYNTILARGLSGSNVFGRVIDGGHNLSSDGSCDFTHTGSLNTTDPKLGELMDNGGPTPTMALLTGSPAIDAGDDVVAPAVDQRGVSRPQGAHVDIGAYEATVEGVRLAIVPAFEQIQVQFITQPNTRYRLESSADLKHWTREATIEPYSTPTDCTQGFPAPTNSHRFFRLVVE